jgi:hypothetical protein
MPSAEIVEDWDSYDNLSVMPQLGLAPSPEQQPSDALTSGQEPTY